MPIRVSVDDFPAGEVLWRLDQRARVSPTLRLQRVDEVELIHLLPFGPMLTGFCLGLVVLKFPILGLVLLLVYGHSFGVFVVNLTLFNNIPVTKKKRGHVYIHTLKTAHNLFRLRMGDAVQNMQINI